MMKSSRGVLLFIKGEKFKTKVNVFYAVPIKENVECLFVSHRLL